MKKFLFKVRVHILLCWSLRMSFQDFLISSKQINHSNLNDSKIKIEEMLLKKNFMVPKPFNVTKEGTKLQLNLGL